MLDGLVSLIQTVRKVILTDGPLALAFVEVIETAQQASNGAEAATDDAERKDGLERHDSGRQWLEERQANNKEDNKRKGKTPTVLCDCGTQKKASEGRRTRKL